MNVVSVGYVAKGLQELFEALGSREQPRWCRRFGAVATFAINRTPRAQCSPKTHAVPLGTTDAPRARTP